MFTMEWLCGQIAFVYAFNKIKPAVIVDGIIEAIVDVVTPGRRGGAGEESTSWFWRHLRSIERDSDRISRELDVRSELRRWDIEFPYLHHELIVRYVAGILASAVAMFAWGQIRSLFVSTTNKRR